MKTAALLLIITLAPARLLARPYYSAKKGLNCAACHYNPSGGGPRRMSERSPMRINDNIALGADFRFSGSKAGGNHGTNPSGFATHELAFYIAAKPNESVDLIYDNNQGVTGEGYALWAPEEASLPYYARAGRFYLPYGLQVDDIDQDDPALLKTYNAVGPANAFSGSVAFNMKAGNNDQGVEVGLNPKKGYFASLAMTNGMTAAAGGESKALTARGGLIRGRTAFGLTGFANTPAAGTAYKQNRMGFFGWTGWGPFVLLGEWGIGRDRPNTPPHNAIHKRAGYAELDYEALPETLLAKLKYEFLNPDGAGSNVIRRYTAALEWFANSATSLELQFRVRTENPEVKNNRGLIAAHVWF